MKNFSFIFFLSVILISCGEDPKPKPNAFLALEYPEAAYEILDVGCPYAFEKNEIASASKTSNDCWITLDYEELNGSIFITYQSVENNLDSLLRDAQNLPLKHTIKADAIEGDRYINELQDVYGMFYEVSGDAASQAQFYVTDSVEHFLTGSVYFNATPNYDSILPAASYLKKDMRHLMESLRWRSGK